MFTCTYLLPLRRHAFSITETKEWANYFETLQAEGCQVLVIDGSEPAVFDRHHQMLAGFCRHLPVDRRFGYLNDKVNGIHTGIEMASCEKIILADDDIRYSAANVRQTLELLCEHEMVRPQNFLSPLPWWGQMEAARMLINRAVLRAADYPGTCAFRRSEMLEAGHYDGDVLFDNEEIIRHFAQQGHKIAYAVDLFVEKCAPTLKKWFEQRPRQAYEDFGMRVKTAIFAMLPPLLIASGIFFTARTFGVGLIALALIAVALATVGRARGQAERVFPFIACLFAPLWILERSISTYAAFYWRLTRGGYPFGDRVLSKGVGRDWFAGGRVIVEQIRATKAPDAGLR